MYQFREEFDKALEGFIQAEKLSPKWEAPLQQIQLTLDYLEKMQDKIAKKGLMKAKKVQQLLDTFPQVSTKFFIAPFSGLQEGINSEKTVVGIIVDLFSTKGFLPITVLVMDKQGSCLPVSCYNIGQNVLKVNDVIHIDGPYVKRISVNNPTTGPNTIQFLSIEVYSRFLFGKDHFFKNLLFF